MSKAHILLIYISGNPVCFFWGGGKTNMWMWLLRSKMLWLRPWVTYNLFYTQNVPFLCGRHMIESATPLSSPVTIMFFTTVWMMMKALIVNNVVIFNCHLNRLINLNGWDKMTSGCQADKEWFTLALDDWRHETIMWQIKNRRGNRSECVRSGVHVLLKETKNGKRKRHSNTHFTCFNIWKCNIWSATLQKATAGLLQEKAAVCGFGCKGPFPFFRWDVIDCCYRRPFINQWFTPIWLI